MTLLSVDRLSVAYGGRAAVRDLSLTLGAGEILALVGESGSGKSTVAHAAMGLLPREAAVSGAIRVAGTDIAHAGEAALDAMRGRAMAMIFQEPMTALNPRMRIGAQVAEAIRVHEPLSRKAAAARAAALLAEVGLPAGEAPPTRYPHQLSGGQRQRVAIAIAIAAGARLLIADEPTTALDVTTQAHVMALLRDLVDRRGVGLLLVSHDLAVVAGVADRVAVLRDGALVEQGGAVELLARPRSAYARMLVDRARHAPPRRPCADRPPLLEVRGLARRYRGERRWWRGDPGHAALEDVSFTVRPGETVGLIGESGAGKSTLLRAVLGLDQPDAGEVVLAGTSYGRARGGALRALRRRVQAVFQDPASSLDPRWRVGAIVAEPLRLLDGRIDAGERRARVERALRLVGLPAGDADRFPHQFSGGQRQRIALARALIVEPSLVVLDEAVSALDVAVRADILDLLGDLSARLGLAYLFVSHDLAMMTRIAHRLIVLRHGRIVEQGETDRLLAAPEHPYTAALLAATPDLDRALAARLA